MHDDFDSQSSDFKLISLAIVNVVIRKLTLPFIRQKSALFDGEFAVRLPKAASKHFRVRSFFALNKH